MNDWSSSVWLGFSLFLLLALSMDAFLLKKNGRTHTSVRTAIKWSLVWVAAALTFNALLWLYLYHYFDLALANRKALDFFTGYLIEKSLSIDNLFAFYILFQQFQIPPAYQQRIFSYGIWGAIIFRLILILLGSWLITEFHWVLFLMGAFLLVTGIKMLRASAETTDLYASKTFLFLQKKFRFSKELAGEKFFIRKNNLLYMTPLFLAVIFIEITDIVFAFDSIPAIFAITTDPFIVWSSNIFAILGLRALYFVLAGMVERFYLLKYGIALILIFIGIKMLLEPWLSIPVGISLAIIASILISFSGASFAITRQR